LCLGPVCAYLATRAALGRRRLDADDRPVKQSYPRRAPDVRGPAGDAFHVLVVEPDGEVLAGVSRRLHEAGLQVAGVPSGKLALRVLEHEGAPDLILADLALPDMSVRSLVTALRAHARAHLPVGYLSREPVKVGRYGGEPVLGRPLPPTGSWR
jgi:PleD family two-component response regulator